MISLLCAPRTSEAHSIVQNTKTAKHALAGLSLTPGVPSLITPNLNTPQKLKTATTIHNRRLVTLSLTTRALALGSGGMIRGIWKSAGERSLTRTNVAPPVVSSTSISSSVPPRVRVVPPGPTTGEVAVNTETEPRVLPAPMSPTSPLLSLPIISLHTVSRSHAICSRRWALSWVCARVASPKVMHFA